jgi:hypothetical protein
VTCWRGAWALWVSATLAALPASALLWFVVGQSWCGMEVSDTPAGSVGDSLCTNLVEPVVPWALVASLPLLVVLVGGLAALRFHRRRLFALAVTAPFVLVVLAVVATTAFF